MSVSILLICMVSYWLTHQRLFDGQGLYPHFYCRSQKDGGSGHEGPNELGQQCRGPQVLVIAKIF